MNNYLTATEIKRKYKLSVVSLYYWENQGVLHPVRTPGGHRRYLEAEILSMLGIKENNNSNKRCAIYARVSTQKQADNGNLDRQLLRLSEYAIKNGYVITAQHKEIASGLNENRKELAKLLNAVSNHKIDFILVEYKDRLASFGFKYLEQFCNSFSVAILETEKQPGKEPQEELVEDMISIVTSFSARLYGKRGGRVGKKLTTLIENEVKANENDR